MNRAWVDGWDPQEGIGATQGAESEVRMEC